MKTGVRPSVRDADTCFFTASCMHHAVKSVHHEVHHAADPEIYRVCAGTVTSVDPDGGMKKALRIIPQGFCLYSSGADQLRSRG